MRGYKAFNQDMTCLWFQYEVGKTYRTDKMIGLCENGFHFCKRISEPFGYYDKDARLFEVEAGGQIIESSDKCVCSEIKVLREITGRRKTLAIYGYGYGDGDGYGYGDGDGYGYGYGYGIKIINGETVYLVDGVQTLLRRVRGEIAKGAILKGDLSLEACFVVKQGNQFAHGKTLAKAMEALRDKLFEDMPEEDRIQAFIDEHTWGVEYPDSDFFDWHHRLTGSCEMGRRQFAAERGLEALDGIRTVESFIELTRNAYGGDVIRRLADAYAAKT